jgi:iron complex transport system substrate-binding protein
MRLPRNDRSLRRFLAVVALPVAAALTLSACAAGTPSGAGDASSAGTETGNHLVQHARGGTEVPSKPQRVVVLEPVQLDTSVALGVIPVGSAVLSEAAGIPKYLGERAAGIASVGTVTEPSIEKIAALKPDLIIGTETRHSALYDQLSSIAPTVYMASQSDPWADNVKVVAGALGDEAGAEKLLTAYNDRCKEIATKFSVAGKTASFIRPRDGVLTLYGPTSFAGSTLECAGFKIPARDWAKAISVDISPERVLEAKADLVLVSASNVKSETALPESVRSNQDSFPNLQVVDQGFWITGVGPLGGMTVLDDIERILTATK